MKTAWLVFLMFISVSAQAWVETPTAEKAHHFVYRMSAPRLPAEVFEISMKAPSYEEAYEKAAQACYQHFKAGQPLNEERGLDIIDVCANPRSL